MKNLLLFLLSFTFFFQSCAMLNPDEKDINAMSLKAYDEVKKQAKISTDAKWTEMLNRVAPRIAKASGENFDWEWMLIDSPEVNAWCMPVLKTEAALAAVLGHEVAHATKRHGKQQYARAVRSNVTGMVIGIGTQLGGQLFCKSQSCRMVTGLGGAAAGLAVTFFDRKYSRSDETEADKVGQHYMAKAGYDPTESIKLWERMSEASAGRAPPEFISTHPSDSTRRGNLTRWLPEAQKDYNSAPAKYGLGEPIN